MQMESNGAETSTDSEEKSKRKSSRPIKIPLVKDSGEEGPQILQLDSPKKKMKIVKTPLQSPSKLRRSPQFSPAKDVNESHNIPESRENKQVRKCQWILKLFIGQSFFQCHG